jgi:hypothetical protein
MRKRRCREKVTFDVECSLRDVNIFCPLSKFLWRPVIGCSKYKLLFYKHMLLENALRSVGSKMPQESKRPSLLDGLVSCKVSFKSQHITTRRC